MDTQARLQQLLQERGWTEYKLSKECGLAQSTIGNIFRRNTLPSIATLETICNGFGITMSQFFAEGDTVELSPELKELTEKIRKDYIEVNGKLMQEFGKLLSRAHELCEEANIRYEDYLDRVLCLPRKEAQQITKVGQIEMNPAIGFALK